MRRPTATSRPAAALWCLLALIAATLLPALHALQPHAHAHAAPAADPHADRANGCGCSHGSDRHQDAPADDDEHEPDGEHECPVCEVMRAVASGVVLTPPAAAAHVAAPAIALSIRSASPPARLIVSPQRTLSGPPAC
jgi:hypothetical protein